MRRWLYDLLGTACTYLPHRWRKWLHRKASTLTSLLDPPGCDKRSCCWPDGPITLSGFEFCASQGDAEELTFEQWAERLCLRAHEIDSDMIVLDSNYGGDMAVTMLRSTWESLIASGKLPPTAKLPRIEQTAARRTRL